MISPIRRGFLKESDRLKGNKGEKEGGNEMLKKVMQFLFVIVGGVAGVLAFPSLFNIFQWTQHPLIHNVYVAALIGAFAFGLLGLFLVSPIIQLIEWFEQQLLRAPVVDIIFGTFGLIIGLIVAVLLSFGVISLDIPFVTEVGPIVLTLIFGYLGFQIGFQKRNEIMKALLQWKTGDRERDQDDEQMKRYKVLDTSVIIDGRIADIAATRFLEGVLVVPQFVLTELQHIADSSDSLKRTKGRRGLDILKRLQEDPHVTVEITNVDFEDVAEVDLKLVRLAKKIDGFVVTNDFNLNKVADLHGVEVLNINDLSNAVKPVVIPGERMTLTVIKEGKEHHQGIAYLEDGTMIVVEDGKRHIGETIQAVVTSVLQTSAGRMIFARPKE